MAKKAVHKRKVKVSSHKAPKAARKSTAKGSRLGPAKMRVYNLTKPIPREQYFVLANGKPVKHVAELASLLDQMEDHVFNHHVTPDRNDFHNWVKDVFQDVGLAKKILGVKDKKHLQLVIYRHMAGQD